VSVDEQLEEADAFARELARRLAPLDEADAMLATLDLDGAPADADSREADVVVLHPHALAQPPTPRAWLWLAAAIVSLGVSVGVLMRQTARTETLFVAGGPTDATRLELAADPATLVALRPVHAALARCIVEQPVAEPVVLTVPTHDSDALGRCLDSAIADLQSITFTLTIHTTQETR
jgi:hypothetical protein